MEPIKTALMLATWGRHLECVEALLQWDADPNILDTVSSVKVVRSLLVMVYTRESGK